jgi:hypothetical protein
MASKIVLIESLLNVIHVFCLLLASIPIIILNGIKEIILNYSRRGNQKHDDNPIINWEEVSKPWDIGGWGIKHIHHSSKAI